MLMDEHFLPEGSASDPQSQVSMQTTAELDRAYDVQVHEIVNAIAATAINAQAGLNWLRAEPPDPEGSGRRSIVSLATLSEQPKTWLDFERS